MATVCQVRTDSVSANPLLSVRESLTERSGLASVKVRHYHHEHYGHECRAHEVGHICPKLVAQSCHERGEDTGDRLYALISALNPPLHLWISCVDDKGCHGWLKQAIAKAIHDYCGIQNHDGRSECDSPYQEHPHHRQ